VLVCNTESRCHVMPESFLPWAEKWCYCHTYTEMWDMLTQNVCGEGANRKSVLRLQSSAM
jgi:hypothetical protein